MSTSVNNFDTIEKIIFEEGLRIEKVSFQPEDKMAVILNTGAELYFPLSSFKRLSNASQNLLNDYEISAEGTGVHWEAIDEDLSLKGFLQESLRRSVKIAA